MPTIQDEKPAKPRARSRKADSRSSKSGQKQVEVRAEPDPVDAMVAETEAVAVAAPPAEVAPIEAVATEAVVIEAVPVTDVTTAVAMEEAREAALSGEVLPPVRAPSSQPAGLQAIAQAYGDYTKKSWLNGRFLVERLIAARSFDEAIEIQGEFAKQAYSNLLAHSERICMLYGEWAQQLFRPLEKFATDWPHVRR